MVWNSPKTVERKIRRLSRELDEIDNFFYRADENTDRASYASMLERKRDDVVRSTVLQIHTSIEDLLASLILYCVMGVTDEKYKVRLRSRRAQAMREVISGGAGIGFDRKIALAVALGLLTSKQRTQLRDLNTIRNKCSHNWLLNVRVRRGKRPEQPKPPLLMWRNRDLHKVATLKDFYGEYGAVYAKLFARWVS